MKTKHINRMFATGMILHVFLVFLVSFVDVSKYIPWNMCTNVFISECTLWIPVVVGALITKTNLIKFCNIKKVKISTLLMTVLFTILIDPLAVLLNALSMLVVDNTVAGVSGQVLEQSFLSMLFFIAIYGPFVEELMFRGVLFHGYRKAIGARAAIFLSAILFGIMHMNLNQAGYAFVIGICLALLCEVTGSMLPGFLTHFLLNGYSVVSMFVLQHLDNLVAKKEMIEAQGGTTIELAQANVSDTESMMLIIAVLLVMVLITLPLAICALIFIAKREGRLENLKALVSKKAEKPDQVAAENSVEQEDSLEALLKKEEKENVKEKAFTPSLIIGIIVCILMISSEFILPLLLAKK